VTKPSASAAVALPWRARALPPRSRRTHARTRGGARAMHAHQAAQAHGWEPFVADLRRLVREKGCGARRTVCSRLRACGSGSAAAPRAAPRPHRRRRRAARRPRAPAAPWRALPRRGGVQRRPRRQRRCRCRPWRSAARDAGEGSATARRLAPAARARAHTHDGGRRCAQCALLRTRRSPHFRRYRPSGTRLSTPLHPRRCTRAAAPSPPGRHAACCGGRAARGCALRRRPATLNHNLY
jgi:hypothetical protein